MYSKHVIFFCFKLVNLQYFYILYFDFNSGKQFKKNLCIEYLLKIKIFSFVLMFFLTFLSLHSIFREPFLIFWKHFFLKHVNKSSWHRKYNFVFTIVLISLVIIMINLIFKIEKNYSIT